MAALADYQAALAAEVASSAAAQDQPTTQQPEEAGAAGAAGAEIATEFQSLSFVVAMTGVATYLDR